ncbi:NAD-dependent epimerase/dehydratase family protein [Nanoarchaeota archaeon]
MDLLEITIKKNSTLKEAMSSIDSTGIGQVLIVDDDSKLLGIATDGDIRRALIKGEPVTTPIESLMNKDIIKLRQEDIENKSQVHETVNHLKNRQKNAHYLPIVNSSDILTDFVSIKDLQKTGKLTSIPEILEKTNKKVKHVLLIGGAGYLGTILTRKLLEKSYNVRVFDILYFGDSHLKEFFDNPNFELIKGDMRNIAEVNKALMGIDAVVLLAGLVGDPACKVSPEETLETNFLATNMVADACKYHQINRFLFASSASVYGVQDGIVNETSKLNPVSLYARSKIISEEAILRLIDENFAPTFLRMGTLYGYSPRMRFDLVVNILTMKAATEGKIKIFGGKQWRPFLHIEDAADAYVKVLEADINKVKGEVFNVGAEDQNCQIAQLGEFVKEAYPNVIIDTIEKDEDIRNYKVTSKKIEETLGFTSTKSIKDGINEIKAALESGEVKDPLDRKHYNS